MTRVVIVLEPDGTYNKALADSETDVRVLRRGVDDNSIDAWEQSLEEVET